MAQSSDTDYIPLVQEGVRWEGEVFVEEAGENVFVIRRSFLEQGTYVITLTKGIEYKELRFIVGTEQENK